MNGHRWIVSSPVFIAAKAFAKVNLCLAVCAPEPAGTARAGWHRIASWFHAIDLHDDIYLERSTDGKSKFERKMAPDAPGGGSIDWTLERDLCFRAVKLLEAHCGEEFPVMIRLRKRIPSGGGLGGGSSNAATVLRSMNSLFGLEIEDEELVRLGQKLGSDVAFFMDGDLDGPPRPALVRGFGDSIQRLEKVSAELSLVIPPFGCSTPQVYQAFDDIISGTEWKFRDALVAEVASRGTVSGKDLFNDLLPAAERVQPQLRDVLRMLEKAGHVPHLSGSGSTIFVMGKEVGKAVGATVHQTRLV